ncbi:MAG: DUF1648 domain-containing protein [Firmicutes bacterium]|nr:DUF1648 domain-containing protein [Bacillota bacterium]
MSNSRPRIDLPLSKAELFLHFLGIAAIVFMAVIFCTVYIDMPDRVPTHWGFDGEIDGYGSKSTYIWITVIGIVMYAGIAVLAFFPHVFNYTCEVTEKNAARLYRTGRLWMNIINVEMIWMFAAMFACGVIGAARQTEGTLMLPVILGMTAIMTVSCIMMIIQFSKAGEEPEGE